MSDPKAARVLVEAAERDIAALRGMDNASVFADEIFGFHTQQAAEKLFKAWLALLGETYPLTHNLEQLLAMLAAREPDAERFDGLVEYTPYAGWLRYDARLRNAPPLERAAAVRRVEALLGAVRPLLTGADCS